VQLVAYSKRCSEAAGDGHRLSAGDELVDGPNVERSQLAMTQHDAIEIRSHRRTVPTCHDVVVVDSAASPASSQPPAERTIVPERTIVVVEDDGNIADLVNVYLRDAGFRVLLADTGERGLDLVDQHRPSLAILDIGLPGIDGFEVCRRIRMSSTMPVLFLTARDGEIDRVLGLELGADDYVTKPFSPRELVARVKAILRRGATPPVTAEQRSFEIGDGLVLDIARREVIRAGEAIALATKEFDLLAFFTRNQGLVLSRQQLIDGVWGVDWYGDDRTVDVHVRQLRRKIGDDLPLATVWGVGYRLG
jgi:two-component system, OmpR family, alkaline phosphatase synthesis response regulator PhoP